MAQQTSGHESADVVVFGATPGGIASAVRAAREGLDVVLVSVWKHLGGTLASGLGLYDASFSGNRAPLVTEIFSRILEEYATKYGKDSENYKLCKSFQTFEAHIAEKVLTEMVDQEPRIRVWREWWVADVHQEQRKLSSVEFERFSDKARIVVRAGAFIDASYEGDLLAKAGAPYRVGRESRSEFGEPHAGRIFTRYEEGENGAQFPYEAAHGLINLRPFDLCTGRIFPGSTGEGDSAIQAYNYRVSLSRDPSNQVPVPRPANYVRENYVGMLLGERETVGKHYPLKSKWLLDDIRKFQFRNHRTCPNNKISWNHGNFPGRNHAYPEASWPERRRILQEHKDHDLGLLWFLQNDPEVPAEVQARAREVGLSRDEFVDNDNFPWEIYVREARRLCGRATFTELDASIAPGIQRTPPHIDSIAITDWMMDSHECTTDRQPGSAYEGAVLLSELSRPGQIPFRCILPPNHDNLLVPVCLSATHVGWGCVRLEPTWIQVAEAAAWACIIAKRNNIMPAAVPPGDLQRTLVSKRMMISFFNEFDMDCTEPWCEAVQFFGGRGFFASYNARPTEYLDHDTARIWVEAVLAEIQGRIEPLLVAQSVAKLDTAKPTRLSYSQFSAMALSVLGTSLGSRNEAGGAIARGHACELLFRALHSRQAGK